MNKEIRFGFIMDCAVFVSGSLPGPSTCCGRRPEILVMKEVGFFDISSLAGPRPGPRKKYSLSALKSPLLGCLMPEAYDCSLTYLPNSDPQNPLPAFNSQGSLGLFDAPQRQDLVWFPWVCSKTNSNLHPNSHTCH